MKYLIIATSIALLSGCAAPSGGYSSSGQDYGAAALFLMQAAKNANQAEMDARNQYMNQQNNQDSQVARELCLTRLQQSGRVGGHCW